MNLLRNKIEYIQNFTDEFDVVTLTETHLDSHVNDDELKLDSFSKKIIRKDRNRSGGGLLIYVKDYLIVQRKPELENYIDETLWVEIRDNGLSFLLCNTYRSDFSDGQYWARLSHAIETGYQMNENIVITGDLNSDLFKVNNNKLLEIMNTFYLQNVIEKATRVTEQTSTLLDPIILSDTVSCVYADVLKIPNEINDHDASFIECPLATPSSFKREVWLYDKTDVTSFRDKLNHTDWNALLNSLDDVDEMRDIFTSAFLQIARDCIPTKLVTVRNYDKPWFTSELRKEIRKRDRLRKIALKQIGNVINSSTNSRETK